MKARSDRRRRSSRFSKIRKAGPKRGDDYYTCANVYARSGKGDHGVNKGGRKGDRIKSSSRRERKRAH